ncbi:MAG: hypothetical protein QMD08_05715 [Actinomycetota bacterium]|nr:hypothetical protein [Actinomycetota bacterium]
MSSLVEAELVLDSDRCFLVSLDVCPLEEKAEGESREWRMVVTNKMTGKSSSLPPCKNREEALGGFAESMGRLAMPVMWGHVSTWGITLNLHPDSRVFYGEAPPVVGGKFSPNLDEKFKKIRNGHEDAGDVKKAIENILKILRVFLEDVERGDI